MNYQKAVKSNQEQAMASWVNYLNQVRLNRLMEALHNQHNNWSEAAKTLKETMSKIDSEIIIRNRGGSKGMHGFVAEVAECGIRNAREQIAGHAPNCEWINDNGPADLIRNGVPIQQKFVSAGNHLSLGAITQHHEKYPDFLSQGQKYQIPKDHYEKIKYLLSISKEQANKMPTSTGSFSLKQWKEVHEFFDNGPIRFEDIEPSTLSYDQVQVNKIENTLQKEKQSLKRTNQKLRRNAYEASKPTFQQGAKVTAASAAIEGGTSFAYAIAKKRREGKRISEFDSKDWKEILKASGAGTLKGGVRGISIYTLTNFTATPAAVASSLCTASFGIAEQAHLLRTGKISERQFITNSEILCLDASVSALSSCLGQALIPVPFLGAVIGNTIGTLLYQMAKDTLSEREQKLIADYLEDLKELEIALDRKYRDYLKELNDGIRIYYQMLEKAFSPNYEEALVGSVALALGLGVPCNELLLTTADVDNYFMN